MADGPRPRNYVEAAAIISGASALLLDGFLEKYRREFREFAAPFAGQVGLEVSNAVEAIGLAAEAYRESVGKRASATGSAARKRAEVSPDSAPMDERISTSDASQLLGVTPRRTRQLLVSGELAGRRLNGRWQVSRQSVLERAGR